MRFIYASGINFGAERAVFIVNNVTIETRMISKKAEGSHLVG